MAATVPLVSFEFFPPKNPEAAEQLWVTIRALAPLAPRFVSVTYGAGGTTRQETTTTLTAIKAQTPLLPAAHLTCVNHTRAELERIARFYWEAGIRHIVALRGDLPPGQEQVGGDFPYASDLVAFLKSLADFEISVAAYPEIHPQALSPEQDLDNLKRKLDAGATRAITQYFFETEDYLRFLSRARQSGISAPIVPGILPVTNFAQVEKFSRLCGARLPDWMRELFQNLDADPDTRKLVAAMVATEQCRSLMSEGVEEFHFYTLNRADLTLGICRRLGLRPRLDQQEGEGIAYQTPPLPVDPAM
ncbi:MAG TPA: methylenetetrahydrofolate reductase [NAD(P)H] [Dongiaceae bacterium]|jgi:methylenetetrahydrofolate reductase (NADPH)|nr:methylenetetrahydrofolate reductase [NAD(P)H] [Dongiaceae bacterium]